jgi:hypothetical protein
MLKSSQLNTFIATLTVAAATTLTVQSAQAASFNYTNFSSTTGLKLVGHAKQIDNKLRLAPAIQNEWGAVWTTTKWDVQDGFETTFQFKITDPINTGADGFAFVIQNSSSGFSALIPGGGTLGYGDSIYYPRYRGIDNSLAVEFDTWYNELFNDPNGNHISIHTRGTLPNSASEDYSLGYTTAIPLLEDGNVHTAKIKYVPGTLSVFLDDLLNPALTVPMDLANILTLDQGKARLGFTADSGGAAWENHDLISWSYKDEITASEEPKSVPESSSVFGLLAFSAISAGLRLLHQGQQKSQDNTSS